MRFLGGGVVPELHYDYIANTAYQNTDFLSLYNSRLYRLDEINDALADMQSGTVMRPVIYF